jgi:hypothetical protein
MDGREDVLMLWKISDEARKIKSTQIDLRDYRWIAINRTILLRADL